MAVEEPVSNNICTWHVVVSDGIVLAVYGEALREDAEKQAKRLAFARAVTVTGTTRPRVGKQMPLRCRRCGYHSEPCLGWEGDLCPACQGEDDGVRYFGGGGTGGT